MLAVPDVQLEWWRRGGDDAVTFGHELGRICHEVGFFVVADHGIPSALFDEIFEVMEHAFALDSEVKSTIDKVRSRQFRGWEALGSEYTNGRVDVREQVDLWTEHEERSPDVTPAYLRLHGPNQWFPDDVLPGSRRVVRSWTDAVSGVADEVLGALSVGLGLGAEGLLAAMGDDQMSLLKLIHYPPTPTDGAGVNAHHDAGFVTILATGGTPGLQIQLADGTWAPATPSRYELVVNLGEVLQSLTGNYLVATPHRVRTTRERYSAAFFRGPSFDMPLVRLALDESFESAVRASERHRSAGFMAPMHEAEAGVGDMASDHRPAVYGEQVWNYFVRSYPDVVAAHYPELVR